MSIMWFESINPIIPDKKTKGGTPGARNPGVWRRKKFGKRHASQTMSLIHFFGVETPPDTSWFILEKFTSIKSNERYDIAFPEILPVVSLSGKRPN